MKQFMDKDFMLSNSTAVRLFETYAKNQPIFDYHCHLSAKEIYENKPFSNLAEAWLGGDHYKWRLMRANGVPEKYITGDASGWEKFKAYAETLSYAVGNPLYHWSHLELQRYFGISQVLNSNNAQAIWEKANAVIQNGGFAPQELIARSNVFAIVTTEDPADSLDYHILLQKENKLQTRISPAFRPDRALSVEAADYSDYMKTLSHAAHLPISNYSELEQALKKRMDDFSACGCVASDHGFEFVPFTQATPEDAQRIFADAVAGVPISAEDAEKFKTVLMLFLGRQYSRRGWAMELHMGAMRSCNSRMVSQIGANTGYDSVADHAQAHNVAALLNELDKTQQCPKTILFTLNPADNYVLGSMTGNFQDGQIPGKIQFGTAWWFQDHRDGMEEQMRVLANTGLLGRFIGMLTDSRSFLSYPRHEYFRRILCNLVGGWVENGEFPGDEETLKTIIEGICFKNVRNYLEK